MLNKLPPWVCWRGGGATGLLNKGGGSNGRLPGLVTKQQAVEFPQVLTSNYNSLLISQFDETKGDYSDRMWFSGSYKTAIIVGHANVSACIIVQYMQHVFTLMLYL